MAEEKMGETTERERIERFEFAAGVAVEVTTASGDVRLVDSPVGTVRMTTNDADPATRLALVECRYDAAANKLIVDTKVTKGLGLDKGRGLARKIKGLVDHVRNDVDVEVGVPAGATVRVRTASGAVSAEPVLASLDVSSASGDLTAREVDGIVKMQTASGDVELDHVIGPVTVKSASGDVRVTSLQGDLSVQSVSGDVVASLSAPGRVDVGNVSGDVTIGVSSGLLVELDVRSISGQLSSQIALDGASGEVGERPVVVKVRSVSGDVLVRRD